MSSRPQTPSSPSPEDPGTSVEAVADLARGAGLRRVAILAWRDIDDAEAGGSELHAHEVASRWAAAGIDVVVRASAVAGRATVVERAGYTAVRRSGRYAVFVKGPMELASGRFGRSTGWSRSGTGCRF